MAVDFDPFAPETNEYSPDKFYTRATDRQGHYETVRWGPGRADTVKMPPHTVARMAALREVCPALRTNADVIRDAVMHYFHMRGEQYRGVLSSEWHYALDQITAIYEIERLECRRQTHEEILTRVTHLLESATSPEERVEFVAVCERAAMTLEIPDFIRRVGKIIDQYRI